MPTRQNTRKMASEQSKTAKEQRPSKVSTVSKPRSEKMIKVDPKVTMTVLNRRAVCDKKITSPNLTNEQLANWALTEFHLSKIPDKTTISKILKKSNRPTSKECLDPTRKKQRSARFPEFEQDLYEWIVEKEKEKTSSVNWKMIMEAATKMAKEKSIPLAGNQAFVFSNGWKHRFAKRHNIVLRHPPNEQKQHESPKENEDQEAAIDHRNIEEKEKDANEAKEKDIKTKTLAETSDKETIEKEDKKEVSRSRDCELKTRAEEDKDTMAKYDKIEVLSKEDEDTPANDNQMIATTKEEKDHNTTKERAIETPKNGNVAKKRKRSIRVLGPKRVKVMDLGVTSTKEEDIDLKDLKE